MGGDWWAGSPYLHCGQPLAARNVVFRRQSRQHVRHLLARLLAQRDSRQDALRAEADDS